MKTPKVILKNCLLPIAVVGAFGLLSYFPTISMEHYEADQPPLDARYVKGNKAFKTNIYLGQGKDKTDPTQGSRRLVAHYGG